MAVAHSRVISAHQSKTAVVEKNLSAQDINILFNKNQRRRQSRGRKRSGEGEEGGGWVKGVFFLCYCGGIRQRITQSGARKSHLCVISTL